MSHPRLDQPFVVGSIATPVGEVPRVGTDLSWTDHWGTFLARWSVGRMDYRVEPGLYAVGDADAVSAVFVTANYKMSFDSLRRNLGGISAWILVLDTQGINVWCAAGKGTFSTEELVHRVQTSGLTEIASHRRLILPQLAAPGVSAHRVRELLGYKVTYGPIRSADLIKFMEDGFRATPEMRRKSFSALERTILIPVELVEALRVVAFVAPVLFLLGGLGGPAGFWSNAIAYGAFAVCGLLAAIVAGAIATPILLPWLPGRAFALKGIIPGLVAVGAILAVRAHAWGSWPDPVEIAGWVLLIPGLATYLAMNFTGASTYTSLSGVRKEMRWALPLQVVSIALGLGLWLTSRFIA